MLLKTFKSNRAVNYFLFPLAGLLLWGRSLIVPQNYPFYKGESENMLYAPIQFLLGESPFIQNLLVILIFIVLAFMMLYINNRYSLLRERTMLPFPLFIILVSGFSGMQVMHPVYPGAVFLLFAIFRLFSAFDQTKSYSAAFDSGFLLGIASLFYLNFFVLFPAFLIGMILLAREPRWREFTVIFTGFLLPFVFAFSYAYLSDHLLEFLKVLEMNVITPNNHFKSNVILQIYTGFLVLLTLFASVKFIQQYDTKKVSTRRYFIVFFLIFFCSVLGLVLIPAVSHEMLIVATIPVTFLTANFFVSFKNKIRSELWFFLLIFMVIVIQFIALKIPDG